MRRKPYSVVLFDEIEKAHEDVWNILLQNVLLLAEAAVMTGTAGYRYPLAAVLTAAILLLNGKTIMVICKRLLSKIREYRGGTK